MGYYPDPISVVISRAKGGVLSGPGGLEVAVGAIGLNGSADEAMLTVYGPTVVGKTIAASTAQVGPAWVITCTETIRAGHVVRVFLPIDPAVTLGTTVKAYKASDLYGTYSEVNGAHEYYELDANGLYRLVAGVSSFGAVVPVAAF